MACDAATLEALSVLTDKNTRLSDRDRLICLASVYGTAAGYANSQVAINAAYANLYQRLSDRDLLMAFQSQVCSSSGVGGGGNDPLVTSWNARAIANGCIPSQATLSCLNTFCVGIRAQTYFTKLKSVNFLSPDSFLCAMTPLIVHAQDVGFWKAQTGAFPAGGNTIVTGSIAELGPLGFRSDYPLSASPGNNNYNPAAIFASRTSWGVTIYTTTNDGLHGPQGISWGVDDGADYNMGSNNTGGFTAMYANDSPTAFSAAFSFYGYYSFNVSGPSARTIYAANSTHAHAVFTSSAIALGGNLLSRQFAWAGVNDNLANNGGTSNWHSFFALHDPLTLAESADFYTRIQTLRVCLGSGFV